MWANLERTKHKNLNTDCKHTLHEGTMRQAPTFRVRSAWDWIDETWYASINSQLEQRSGKRQHGGSTARHCTEEGQAWMDRRLFCLYGTSRNWLAKTWENISTPRKEAHSWRALLSWQGWWLISYVMWRFSLKLICRGACNIGWEREASLAMGIRKWKQHLTPAEARLGSEDLPTAKWENESSRSSAADSSQNSASILSVWTHSLTTAQASSHGEHIDFNSSEASDESINIWTSTAAHCKQILISCCCLLYGHSILGISS